MDSLPSGLTPIEDQALPPGLTPIEAAPEASLPAGLTLFDPLNPEKTPPSKELSNTDVPGFWSTVGSAFSRGVTQRVADDISGAKAVLPEGLGGETLEDQFKNGQVVPKTQDAIDGLLQKRINEGFTDPKWYGAQIAHGVGSAVPGIGVGLGGGFLAGAPGLVGGFASEAGLGTLVPAYKKARDAGLSVEDAKARAIKDSGLAAAFAGAMGLAPGVSFFGKEGVDVGGQIVNVMKRPVAETLAQIGLVQPSLGIANELVTDLSHGEVSNPWDLATTGVVGVGMGGALVGAHAAVRQMNAAARSRVPEAPPADPEAIKASFENQKPPEPEIDPQTGLKRVVIDQPAEVVGKPEEPLPAGLTPVEGSNLPEGFSETPTPVEGAPPAETAPVKEVPEGLTVEAAPSPETSKESAPPLDQLDEDLHPARGKASPTYYSAVKEAVEQKIPDNASVEQVLSTLKNAPGIKEEEINALHLPAYLADVDGKVNKKDLIAHIEANQLELQEVKAGPSEVETRARQLAEVENGPGSWDTLDDNTKNNYLNDVDYMIKQDYTKASRQGIEKYGLDFAKWPPEALANLERIKNEVKEKLAPARNLEYPNHARGKKSNQREFILKVPPKGEPKYELSNRMGEKPKPIYDRELNYFHSHWPDIPNPVAHILLSDRVDHQGRRFLHADEIQSDVHQEGRKIGYKKSGLLTHDNAVAKFREFNKEGDALNEKYPGIWDSADNVERAKAEGKFPKEVIDYLERRKAFREEYRQAAEDKDKLPDLPFKTTWDELAVKRILRLAADEGYDGVSWANGDQVGMRQGTAEQLAGSRMFYDKRLSSLFQKWARKVGADIGTTQLDLGDLAADVHPAHRALHQKMGLDVNNLNPHNKYVEVSLASGTKIRQGFPLYDKSLVGRGRTLSEVIQKGWPKNIEGPGKKIVAAIGDIGKRVGLSRGITFRIGPVRHAWRGKVEGNFDPNGNYVININTRIIRNGPDLYATVAHELGHVIMRDKWTSAPEAVKLGIEQDFRNFRDRWDGSNTVGEVRRVRDNMVSEVSGGRNLKYSDGTSQNDVALSDLMPRSRSYLLHWEEYTAEQVAKWATTSEKPLSSVDKFYKSLGKTIRKMLEKFKTLTGGQSPEPTFMMKSWLDSMISDSAPFAADIKDQMELDTKRRNQAALDKDGTPEVNATPATASTIGGRNLLSNLKDNSGAGPAMAAHGDRMNRFFEWMTSLPQITEMNKHIRGLVMYKEIHATMNVEKNNIMTQMAGTLKKWKAVRDPRQQMAIGKFIDDYMRGMFKDPSDKSGEIRRPTEAEFTALAKKHGLSNESLGVFNKVVQDFDQFLLGYKKLLENKANQISDPDARNRALADIEKKIGETQKRPYMPAMRFGKYTITVYDSEGNIKHFEQAESLSRQRKIKTALEKHSDLMPGDRVRMGMIPKDSAPLIGMPAGLLDLMAEKLELSEAQRGVLDKLKFDYAPSQSFRHQFNSKELTPGYSTDFQRAYANFFFHGANHVTRVKWIDALRDQIREVKASSLEMDDANKRDQIANYLDKHFEMVMDPKPDFAALRGLMFHWYLGFNPASAAVNLTQTPLMTFPHLASKFGGLGKGDLRATAALARASLELNNFRKKGTLLESASNAPAGPAGAKARALAEMIKEGVISETQAHYLAAASEGRNLLSKFGTKGEEAWTNFSNASSWMFEMTEQANRRVAAMASWDLAMRDPNNQYVKETVRDNPLQYQRLIDRGWTHQEAAAFTAAKDSVEKTQFVYAPYSRPKFMWGKKGALFIFKSFMQNTLFNLASNPAMGIRSLLILGVVGGMMGLPGIEDINGILKAIAFHFFGKDFDLEDEGRKFATDVLHGAISPDMLLHGTATKGYGIPHVLDMMGSLVGVNHVPVPVIDQHASLGLGNLLPFEPGKAFGPTKNQSGAELQQLQRASGAGFGLGFSMYKFLTSQQSLGDLKRWEAIMPRAMSNVSHAFRFATQGKETTASGAPVVRFDVTDTEQMGEILAKAAGFQPRRLTAAYELMQGQNEAAAFWDIRKQILLRQFASTIKSGSVEDKASVLSAIKNYNNDLPQDYKANAISAKTIRESLMNRFRSQAKAELGVAQQKKNILMFNNMKKYYPDAAPPGMVNVRPVK